MPETDPLDQIVERIADAVLRKMDEREKIDLVAQAVLERLNQRDLNGPTPMVQKSPPTRASRVGVRKSSKRKGR